MPKPKLSIVTVVLNGRKTIQNTIRSIEVQTFSDFEYIVVDGGSIDGTLDILNNKRIDILIKGPDLGIYDAMNKGINAANGELVYFLGADDVLCDANVISDVLGVYKKQDFIYGNIESKRSRLSLKGGNMPSHQALFINRQRIIGLKMFDTTYSIAGDFDMLCRSIKQGFKGEYFDRTIAICGTSGVSSTNRERLDKEKYQIIKNHFGKVWATWYLWKKRMRRLLFDFLH